MMSTDRAITAALDEARIVKPTDGAVFRAQRWLDLRRPAGDTNRLAFVGACAVRRIIVNLLLRLHPMVRHYALEAVQWRETGRGCYAWIGRGPARRVLPGDEQHEVNICGAVRDEDLPGVLAHELGHGFHRTVVEEPREPSELTAVLDMLTPREVLAAVVLRHRSARPEEQQYERAVYIGSCVAREQLADAQARAWGAPHRGPDASELRRQFAAEYDDAARLASTITEDSAA